MGRRAEQNMVRGTRAASYTYLATVYTTLGIRARPARPTRSEGAPGLVPRPARARLFVRPVESTGCPDIRLTAADLAYRLKLLDQIRLLAQSSRPSIGGITTIGQGRGPFRIEIARQLGRC